MTQCRAGSTPARRTILIDIGNQQYFLVNKIFLKEDFQMVQIHHKNPVSSLYAGVGELAQPHGLGPWFWRFKSSRPYHMPLQLSWQSRCFVNIRSGVQVPLAAVIMKKPSRGDDVFTNSSNMNKKADYFFSSLLFLDKIGI